MSVDFYVALPAGEWPSAAAVEHCAARENYPIKITRFPTFDAKKVVTDGVTIAVDGRETYLEGALSPAILSRKEVRAINQRIAASAAPFRIKEGHALTSFRVRSPGEMHAASYVIASLVVCFGGYGFEPQGNTHGRGDFAKSLIEGAALLKDH